MAVYLLYVASPILVYLWFEFFNQQLHPEREINWNSYLIVCGIIMFAMIGFRSEFNGSVDTSRYFELWNRIRKVNINRFNVLLKNIDLEKGYLVSVFVLTRYLKHPQWQLIITGAFFAITICNFVKKNCNSPPIALVAFNCLGTFNFMLQGLRQAIAMCVCLWALEQIKKKHYIKTAVLICIAASFHGSAYVFVVVALLSRLKFDTKGILFFSGSIVASFIFLPNLFLIMGNLIEDEYELNEVVGSGGVVAILIYFAIIAFGLFAGNKKKKFYQLYLYMAIVAMVCMIMRNMVSTISERVAQYFVFGEIATLSNSLEDMKNDTSKDIMWFVICVLLVILATYKASYSELIPYNFFWETK